mmetsp:Transcript_29971/g.47608  ORF Transcript_29971/g.47608 Transcript_29971/m.47608 type:complete len:4002 (-) Transcript_29971:1624-13629(-)
MLQQQSWAGWVSAAIVTGVAVGASSLLNRWTSKETKSKHRNEFLQAACDGDIDKLVKFLSQGQDLSCADKNGSNALMLAAWAGRREAVLILLHSNADVDAVSHHGWTALTYASRAGEASTVEVLLEWGAQVNVVESTTGATPLMFAAFVGSLECVELLLDHGADPLTRTRQGALAFVFAEENGHEGIAGMLRHRAADAQAELQAIKEQQEAVAARQKAKQALLLRKKQEQAYIAREEELRQKLAVEKQQYLSSFRGQVEILSVGCYVYLDEETIREIISILMHKQWNVSKRTKRRRAPSGANSADFELLHKDLMQRRALNALSRPMLKELNTRGEESDSEEIDSDESEEEYVSKNLPTRTETEDSGKSTGTSSEPPPIRLMELLALADETISGKGYLQRDRRSRLIKAMNAVNFRNESMEYNMGDDSELYEDLVNALKIIDGLGSMAKLYLRNIRPGVGHASGARTHMPYFLQLEPQIFAPLAKLLVALTEARSSTGLDEIPSEIRQRSVCSLISITQAHLATISLLRLETTRCRDALAILGDALVYIVFSSTLGDSSFGKLRSNTDAYVGGGLHPQSVSNTTRESPRSRTMSEMPASTHLSIPEISTELGINAGESLVDGGGSDNSPEIFASRVLTQYLRVIARSTYAQNKFLMRLWKRAGSGPKALLRRYASEALVEERAISYLVCQAPDSPRPFGDVPSSKRRLARVLGVSDSLPSMLVGNQSAPINSRRFRTSDARAISNVDDNEVSPQQQSPAHQTQAIKRTRFSSVSRRDSVQNRVRVRSVLGEANTRKSSGMLKRRSQALMTIQRAARSFVQAGRCAAHSSDFDVDGSVGSASTCSYGGTEWAPSCRTPRRERRLILLDEVESLLCDRELSNLTDGKIPDQVFDWIQDSRRVLTSMQSSSSTSSVVSDAPPPLDPEVERIATLVPPDLSLCKAQSHEEDDEDSTNTFDLFLRAVVENNDVRSAVLLRCIEDDLISRLLVFLEKARKNPQTKLENVLLSHCKRLFSACIEKSFRNSDRSYYYKKKEASERCLVEDIACELMERLNTVSSWENGACFLSPVLLEIIQEQTTPAHMKSCATKLLCSFAKHRVKAVNLESLDESIEKLLFGPLFTYPVPTVSVQAETTEVFLQDLACSPAKPVHQSKAQALHASMSKKPQLRMITAQVKGKPQVLEDVVRITVAAYLKHSGTASLAYRIAHPNEPQELGEEDGDDALPPSLVTTEDEKIMETIWKAAWETARTIISVYRRSQRVVCAEDGCSHPVVEDNGGWRCESGHVHDTHDVEEVRTYQELCADVAARARILFNQGASTHGLDSIHAILRHAKKFIESAATDNIKADRLELYLKNKSRQSLQREQGLKVYRDAFTIVLKSKSVGDSGEHREPSSMRLAAIKTAADVASSYIETGNFDSRRSVERRNSVALETTDSRLEPLIVGLKEALLLMPRRPDTPGHHPLMYVMPSTSALEIQTVSLDILDILLKIAEHCLDSEELCLVLSTLQIWGFCTSDYHGLIQLRFVQRFVSLVDEAFESGDEHVIGATWSIFSRIVLQTVNAVWLQEVDAQNRLEEDSDKSDSFYNGYSEVQRVVAVTIRTQLSKCIQAMTDSSDPSYENSERHCYRYVCLLGALCSRKNTTKKFSSLLATQDGHLLVDLIVCSSPRIQQLAIRLGRRILAFCDPKTIVHDLFRVAGEWSLNFRDNTSAVRSTDLALECAGLLRYLAGRYPEQWRPAILSESTAAATLYLQTAPFCAPETFFRFWTTLAIFNMSAQSTLRDGCRVKVVSGSGYSGWNESRKNQEYGIVIHAPQRNWSGTRRPASEAYSEGHNNCIVVLDSEPTKIPTKYDPEKLIPVTIMLEEYKDLFIALRGTDWLLNTIDLFAKQFWNSTYQRDFVWNEFKSMGMSVLHAWLSTDPVYAIKSIASERPWVWRNIVSICACPAPASSLENVDDLATTSQAFSDLKIVLCEMGLSPLKSVDRPSPQHKAEAVTVKAGNGKHRSDSSGSSGVSAVVQGEDDVFVEKSGGDIGDEHKSLLSAPLLQPNRRAALARQASTQMFPQTAVDLENASRKPSLKIVPASDADSEDMPKVLSPMNQLQNQGLRRNSSSNMSRMGRRYSGSVGNVPIGYSRGSISKKTVKFEPPEKIEMSLQSPFQEMDREDQSGYSFELHIERNRRRARMERKRRAARRLRTLSSSSVRTNSPRKSISDASLSVRVAGDNNVAPLPSLCQPDTPRGRDAAAMSLPVELPTVDTMLSVPVSTIGSAKNLGPRKENMRAVVKEGTLLRISQHETGSVEQVQHALNGNEMAYIHVFNSLTGFQTSKWCDIAELELSEDIIADRYRLSTPEKNAAKHPNAKDNLSSSPSGKTRESLRRELRHLCTRSAILNARRGAVAAISGSVGLTRMESDQMQLLVGEAGGASQILGMLKLCESSSSSDFPEVSYAMAALGRQQNTSSSSRGLWSAVAVLFATNDDFADMLLDEAVLYLSMTAKETLFFETPHPLCPTDEEEDEEDEDSVLDSASEIDAPMNIATSTSDRNSGEGSNLRPESLGTSQPRRETMTKRSESIERRERKLSGSHRFYIKGASGILVEFDRRSSIISAATQVTLSYDPQDREVIKVLGEGGTDTWQPVVVSGDTCYIHWNVNQSEILTAVQRMDDLNIDIDEVAWGVAVRVRPLEEVSNVDEMQVLEKPFGWRLMQVIAENPSRVLSRKSRGIPLFDTVVSYLRTKHLAFKPELCEVLTLLTKARMEQRKHSETLSTRWDDIMRQGLYKLHHDLLVLFDEVAEDGFTSVSPYFVTLLELLVLCRKLWALHYPSSKDTSLKYVDPSTKAPLCSLIVFGKRENSKVVIDCETCGLVASRAICLACAATCHRGHTLVNERATLSPCGCSLRGPEFCGSLRPFADVWRVGLSDRTWFDVVCQTADVIDCISTGEKSIPLGFVRESYRTCEDGKILRLCLRNLEECLRSEVQDSWWDRDARHMWANMLDQGMDSIAEVAFGLKVLVSSLLPSAFLFWWDDRKEEWFFQIHTNQAWALAQAMLQFSYALSPSACYPEWDSRLQNWTTTLEGIANLGGEDSCTFLLTGEFPRPQVYLKCITCAMEICENCASTHDSKQHKLSEETYGPGFCDERTQGMDDRDTYEAFSQVSVSNFSSLHELYWMNHDANENADDQVPTEPRTLAALLNVPYNAFEMLNSRGEDCMDNKLRRCVPSGQGGLLSPCLEGILVELLGVKEDCSFLCVSCDVDHGFSLAIGSFLTNGCRRWDGNSSVHGIVRHEKSRRRVLKNMSELRIEMGVPLGRVSVFSGDLLAHARAVSDFPNNKKKRNRTYNVDPSLPAKEIPGLLHRYDRIFCNGACTLEVLDALSAMLPLDGALLCPMVDTLGYGIYVQRNQFTGECENRTLAPLYEESEKFIKEITKIPRVLQPTWDEDDVEEVIQEEIGEIELDAVELNSIQNAQESLFERIGETWDLESWISLANFANHLAGRETTSLCFRDVNNETIEAYPLLQQVEDLSILQGRFAVLKRVNESLSEVLPLINLTPQYSAGGIGKQLSKQNTKKLIFLSTKLDAWSKVLEPNWSHAPPSNMPSITVSRKLADSGMIEDTLFMQTYNQVQNFPLSSLRRRDQSFKVRFAGEGGHDVGGLYRDLFTEICSEIREGRPPIMFHSPQMSKARGEPLLPRPGLISPIDTRLFEFFGSLIGIACMRHGITLSLDVSALVWKVLVKDQLVEQDLRFVDEVALQAVSFIRHGDREGFDYVFSDTVFALPPSDSNIPAGIEPSEGTVQGSASDGNASTNESKHGTNVVELCPLGKERKVTLDNAQEYADLVEGFRLNEFRTQIDSVKRGIVPLVPVRLLPMFTWQELENLVCGVADVDVELLHSRTKYVGGVSITDPHIKYFWDVLGNEFTPEDRTQFLRFVWGRERMSTTEEGNTFVIAPHLRSRDSANPDTWLPVAHTCFFSIDIPAYSSKEILKSRLLFAMHNCNAIDADDTGEGHANMALSFDQ